MLYSLYSICTAMLYSLYGICTAMLYSLYSICTAMPYSLCIVESDPCTIYFFFVAGCTATIIFFDDIAV